MNQLLSNSYCNIKNIFIKNINLVRGNKILDLGCGWRGNFFAENSENYYGIDSNQRLIKRLKKSKTGTYTAMDARELKFESDYFDYVISVSVVHHLSQEDIAKILSEVRRVLKKGGKIIIADGVYPQNKWNIIGWLLRFLDRGRYVRTKFDLRSLLSVNLNIEKEYYFVDKIFAYSVFVLSFKSKTGKGYA